MLRRLASSSSALRAVATVPGFAVAGQARPFYDKIRKEREGSDPGPEEMFHEFPKNPSSQRVPEVLHQGNKDAVDTAELLSRAFFVGLVVLMLFVGYFLDPFNSDQYRRPNKLIPVVEPIEKVPPRWAASEQRQ